MALRYGEIHDGMDVFDVNADRIGNVSEVYDAIAAPSASGGGYMRVHTGFLGLKERHIPFSAIRDLDASGVYLRVSKSRLDDLQFDEAPTDVEELTEPEVPTTDVADAQASTAVEEPSGWAGEARGLGERVRRLVLREEQLIPRRRQVETGQVEVSKDVVTEQQTIDVPVTREEVTIERHPVDREPSGEPMGDTAEQVLSVPVRREEVEVDKQPVVYEQVEVGKEVVQETQEVSEPVQREEAHVEQQGDVQVVETPPSRVDPPATP